MLDKIPFSSPNFNYILELQFLLRNIAIINPYQLWKIFF